MIDAKTIAGMNGGKDAGVNGCLPFIGIDPGISGAIAIVNRLGVTPRDWAVEVHDWSNDTQSLFDLLPEVGTVFIETVHFDRRDGDHKRSAEVLIRSHQTWKTLLDLKPGLEVLDLYPIQWRKLAGFKGGADKEQALEYALSLFPEARSSLFYKSRNGRWKRNHNRAEALLMAYAASLVQESLGRAA